MASLSLVAVNSSAAVNLTTGSPDDWAFWSDTSSGGTPQVRKSGGGSIIPAATLYNGGGFDVFGNNPAAFSWSGGTPTATGTSRTEGIWNNQNVSGTQTTGMGFQLVFPADTTTRTLVLYCGAYSGELQITASLSDSSASPVSDTGTIASTPNVATSGYATIVYSAASAGQTLTVRIILSFANGGYANPTLSAATIKAATVSGITGAGQIASAEAVGSPVIAAGVAPTGVASAQAFGSAAIAAGISTTGIATAESVGAPSLAATISAIGIASAEAFGLPVVAPAGVVAAGIPSAEAFGAPGLAASIAPAGVGSAEAFGAALVGAGVAPVGISTGEILGAPSIAAGIGPAAIPGGEAFGGASLAAAIQAAGTASGEAFGSPLVQSSGVYPVGIPSAEASGQPALAAAINALGIGTGEAFGNPRVGAAPAPTGMLEIDMEQAAPRRQRVPERNFKPLLQRVLDARYPRVKPAKERAQRRAKAIEQDAAQLVADEPQNEARFNALMRQWQEERPAIPAGADARAVFEAQVGFRLRQLELVQQARAALARQRDEEDAIAVLLLLS